MSEENANILKKVTIATVCGKQKAPEKETELMRVFGRLTGMKTGETNYGPFIKFVGSIAAINVETGEEFRSRNLILPEVAEGMLAEPFSADEKPESVDFALAVGIKPSDAPIGYEYTVKPLIKMDEAADPLAKLKSELSEKNLLPNPSNDGVKVGTNTRSKKASASNA